MKHTRKDCAAWHINYGGGCLNCGAMPERARTTAEKVRLAADPACAPPDPPTPTERRAGVEGLNEALKRVHEARRQLRAAESIIRTLLESA